MENKVEVFSYKSCKATITLDSNSFAARDVKSITKHPILEILSLKSEDKCNGHATKVLFDIIHSNADKLIILKAEPMFATQEEWCACIDLKDRIANLVKFYENRGFISINDLVGYESAEAMCYKNEMYYVFKKKWDDIINSRKSALNTLLNASNANNI